MRSITEKVDNMSVKKFEQMKIWCETKTEAHAVLEQLFEDGYESHMNTRGDRRGIYSISKEADLEKALSVIQEAPMFFLTYVNDNPPAGMKPYSDIVAVTKTSEGGSLGDLRRVYRTECDEFMEVKASDYIRNGKKVTKVKEAYDAIQKKRKDKCFNIEADAYMEELARNNIPGRLTFDHLAALYLDVSEDARMGINETFKELYGYTFPEIAEQISEELQGKEEKSISETESMEER